MQVAARFAFYSFEVLSHVKGEGLCLVQEFGLRLEEFISGIFTTPGHNVTTGSCGTSARKQE